MALICSKSASVFQGAYLLAVSVPVEALIYILPKNILVFIFLFPFL